MIYFKYITSIITGGILNRLDIGLICSREMQTQQRQQTFFSKSGRLNDVVIIRSLAIIMVVAFHAYYMMMIPGHLPKSAEMYHDMYYNLHVLILKFRMPLFITISGYLFSHLENDRGKYATFKGLFQNKFKRLIIPFFVFATLFSITLKNFNLEPYYSWEYAHLWFIPMLFWCFIFTRLQSFLPWSGKAWWKIALLAGFYILHCGLKIKFHLLGLQNFLSWYFWFYFGYQLYLNRDRVYGGLNNHKILYSIILWGFYIAGCWIKDNMDSQNGFLNLYSYIANLGYFSIVILFWYWINYTLIHNWNEGRHIKSFNWLNKHAYGIYVLHYWLQPFLISATAVTVLGVDGLALEYPILFPLAFFLSSFVLSLGLTWLLLKTRVGKFLIG